MKNPKQNVIASAHEKLQDKYPTITIYIMI